MKTTVLRNSRRRTKRRRSGVAAAEFAACLPILILLIIGTIEACAAIYLKQTLSVAAYEGIRTAVERDAAGSDVEDACDEILSARNVNGAVVRIEPNDFAAQPKQSWITVRISAPVRANSVIPGWFYNDLVLHGSATMMKEY